MTDATEKKAVLIKTIERDATLAMHGIYARVINGDNEFGFGKGVQRPFFVSYATGQNIQLWENQESIGRVKDAFYERNAAAPAFMAEIVSDQRATFEALEKYWSAGTVADSEIETYVMLLRRGMINNAIYYYSGLDERTPEEVLRLALEIRKEDEFYAKGDEFVRTFAVSRGIERRLAPYILPDELTNLPDAATLQLRSDGIVLCDGEQSEIGTLEAYAARHPEIVFSGLNASTQSASEVQGRSAYKGIVRGTVRIVKNREHAAHVQAGDIIVSPMTTPDFIDAMHRAAGFVTDEGGITCHAAIVAREMAKPCVIGTQYATKIFQDGDLVEVDAEQGIVRKI